MEVEMKLSVKGLALTAAIVWGGCILLTGILNLIWTGYGAAFLDMARSIYPGYQATRGFPGVIVGTLYGAVDGAVGGAVFAWIYNKVSGSTGASTGA
jgi:hypothetical protein